VKAFALYCSVIGGEDRPHEQTPHAVGGGERVGDQVVRMCSAIGSGSSVCTHTRSVWVLTIDNARGPCYRWREMPESSKTSHVLISGCGRQGGLAYGADPLQMICLLMTNLIS